MKKIFIVLTLVLVLTGCTSSKDDGNAKNNTLNEIIEQGNYIIVDVRTNEEYEDLHIKGPINIPLQEIDDNVDLDKSKKILVYCRSGARSKSAATKLQTLGYNVIDLGGIDSIDLEKE